LERKEFEQLALEHLDAVYRLALHLVGRPDDAADLVQETYLRALKVAEGFTERGGGMRPWLFKILHNVFYNRSGKVLKVPAENDIFYEQPGRERIPGESEPVWSVKRLDWEQVDEGLKGAIERLSPEYREVLLLWGVEDMKYREIADILGVPIGTVMSRLHRARAILVKELTEADNGPMKRGLTRIPDRDRDNDE